MNIRDLDYIIAVAELGHFGKAAQRCFVSQPTLSGQIKKLEDELQVQLFERSKRGVIITDIGQQILKHARGVMHHVQAIRDAASYAKNPMAGRIRVGAIPTMAPYIFPHLARQIKIELPDLSLVLVEEKTDDLIHSLKEGKIDAAFMALPVNDEPFNITPLAQDHFYIAMSSDNKRAQQKQISLSDLQDENLILLEEGHCLRDQALEICTTRLSDDDQSFRATSLDTVLQMVAMNAGVTLVPAMALNRAQDTITYKTFAGSVPYRTIALVSRKTSYKEGVIAVIKQIASKIL